MKRAIRGSFPLTDGCLYVRGCWASTGFECDQIAYMKRVKRYQWPYSEWRCDISWTHTTLTGLQLQKTLENLKPFEG
jgi:hypothetical protein